MPKSNFNRIVGEPNSFSVENRTLNLVAAVAIALQAIGIATNIVIDLPQANIALAFGIVVVGAIYYLGRFKKRFGLAWLVMVITGYSIMTVSFFINNGSDGSVVMASITILFLVIAITKARYHILIVVLHLALFLTLMFIEYLHPELIPNNYPTRFDRFLDVGLTFFNTIVFLSVLLMFIRKTMNEQTKKIEEQRAELERSNTQLRRIFSVLSHDLRTPLNNIQAYLEILQDGSLSIEDEKGIKAQLLKSTKNSSAILNPILEWSKLELKGESVRGEHTEVDALIKTSIQHVEDYAEEKEVTIDYSDCPYQVVCAPDQMVVIIRNLLHNAIKFSEAGQKVMVYCREIEQHCTICIQDEGRGMTPEEVERLFTLESRSKRGTNSELGSGIGLILSKQLAALNGADIEVESAPGHGTTMMVKFDVCDAKANHSSKTRSLLI